MTLLGTPFHPRTAALNQTHSWRRWAGYLAAGSYELSHEREYWAIRNSAALLDVSPLYKYHLSGPDAATLLNRVVTRDIGRLAIGQVFYTPWCDEHGKVLDDGTVSRLDDNLYRLTSAEPCLRWLHLNALGLQVTIEDVSARLGALAVQGPQSRLVLDSLSNPPISNLKYFRLAHTQLARIPVTVSRTGYTGDLGYEIWVEAEQALPLWDVLLEAGAPYGLTPAGILALDVARVEAGLILLDVDYTSAHVARIESQKSSPFELNLGWTVSVSKTRFNGRRALLAEKQRGPAWRLVGLEVDWPSLERLYLNEGLPPQLPTTTLRASVPIASLGRQVGYASSSCWSPLLKKFIALAHLEAAVAQPGQLVMYEVTIEHKHRYAPARVVELPFFDPERKRA